MSVRILLLAGAVCDFRLGYGRVLSRRSKIIAINRDKDQLYKVFFVVVFFMGFVCVCRYACF